MEPHSDASNELPDAATHFHNRQPRKRRQRDNPNPSPPRAQPRASPSSNTVTALLRSRAHVHCTPCFPRSCELRYRSIRDKRVGEGTEDNSRIGRADKPKTLFSHPQPAAMESLRSFFVKPTPKEQVRLRAPLPLFPVSRRPIRMAASCAGEHNLRSEEAAG